MNIRVFKFGGASVNSERGVRNVASILNKYPQDAIIAVVSAMGKTTNALETLLAHFLSHDAVSMVESFNRLKDYHFGIIGKLFKKQDHPVYADTETLFTLLQGYLRKGNLTPDHNPDYDYNYDQVVSYGELISTTIISHYLNDEGIPSVLFDARKLIFTDSSFRDARVNWDITKKAIQTNVPGYRVAVTQGFIGSDLSGNTTTLGREGSDYSAAIFAYCLKIKEMTIWKDVPGIMNADPKWFKRVRKIDTLSYQEAIELAYFGASVIHPKTIKPLENANITLHVKSFLRPDLPGTTILNLKEWSISTPIYIRKQNQLLLSISPHDFSFIMEENLGQIFTIFAAHHVKVNVMQNSAISFSVCVDANTHGLKSLISELRKNYAVRYNDHLELYTIRHYDTRAVNRIVKDRKILLEQKTRNTVHLVVTE
jgi:aspartate kinase